MNIRRHPKALIETFESRILYSADPGPAGLAAAVLGGFEQPGNGTGGAVQQGGSELVFVDSRVPDIQQLLDDLAAQQRAGRTVEVFVVGSDDDGLALIGASLAGRHDIAAVHVLGHGSAGVAEVGATRLDAESVFLRAGEIAAWGDALSVDADLLLYGCDVAADAGGRSLVSALAQLTGADVAASDDLTGAAALGGDWNLEYTTGSIETAVAPSVFEQQAWSGILAISANGTATSTNTTNTSTTPLSWSHTVAAGSNRVMFVELSISTSGTYATGVTYGGVGMTLVGRSSSGVVPVEIWKLVNPTVGTASVVASFSATTAAAGGATTYNGVDQTTPVRGSFVSAFGNSTTVSVTVASAPGDLVIDAQSWQGLPSGGAPGPGQTITWSQQNASITGGSTSEAGAASVEMSSSFGSSTNWVIGAVSLKAAAGITVTPISGLTVTEGGGTAQFSVVLDSAPTANVTVGLTSSNTREGTLSASSLTFTTANWNVAQTVTVTGVDDTYIDGNTAFSVLTAAATSTDPAYSGLNPADVSLINTDNDTVNTLVVDTTSDTSGANDGTTTSIAALMANKGTDGKISLREAITAANATANGSGGADRIHFAISGTGIHTITLGSLLPDIVDALSIDATTDDSFTAAGSRPAIVLDGGNIVQDGLRLYPGSGGSTIRGLIIQSFTQDGIDIGSSSGNTVAGNWIGLNSAGTGAAGNQQGVNIWNANNNIIGGITAADRNVLSGNTGEGVYIGTDNATSTGNQIRGNYIGLNAAGTAAVGNLNLGVLIESGASNTVGGSSTAYGNVIAGTLNFEGIRLGATASSTTVSANVIGLAADGSTVLGNAAGGVAIYSANNTIGGTTAGARNIISGNASGVIVSGASATGNLIVGNYIGTDSTGLLDRGNTADGVLIEAGASSNTLGGSTAGHRNIISGNNQDGVQVDGETSDNNTVRGNWIGINAAGTATLGNSGDGVYISSGADGTNVGGSTAAEGNWIAAGLEGVEVDGPTAGTNIRNNRIGTDVAGTANWGMQANGILIENSLGGAGPTNIYISSNTVAFSGQSSAYDAGIAVLGTGGANISISANSIYSNVGMGIDLGVAGVTANDAGDADTGPNQLQNFPVLTLAKTNGSDTLTVGGTLNSTASTSFKIEVFSNPTLDAGGYGEGRTSLGTFVVTTNASGDVTFSNPFSVAVAVGQYITATASRYSGGFTFETSEFSRGVAAISSTQASITVDTVSDTSAANDGDTTSLSTLLANKGSDGFVSLREAIIAANNTANGTGGADRIEFSIAGPGPHSIALTAALPTVTQAVIIDGTVEPDFAGTPVIELNGAGAGASSSGILLGSGSSGSTVKGLVINRFSLSGIRIEGGSGGNLITGNYIGTDTTGLLDRGNTKWGLDLEVSGGNNVIGGSSAALRNVISGNDLGGVSFNGAPVTGNLLQGNYIGAGSDGTTAVGNGGYGGVLVLNGASATIGGVGAGLGNLIAYNTGRGLDVRLGTATILGNAIVGNSTLGIDLGDNGSVEVNDTGDGDTGANTLQNYPVLTSATYGGDRVLIVGTLNSTASTTFRLEFFSSVSGDASAHGEGQVFLGAASVTTDSSGNASFSVRLTGTGMTSSRVVSATATVDLGGGTYGGTSEFSANINSVAAGPTVSVPPTQTVAEDGSLVFSSVNGNAITVGDGMAGDGRLQVALASPNGTLTLGGTAGLTIMGGANGSAGMVLWGTKSALNAALNGLVFTPAGNFNGSASISVTSALAADLAGYYPFSGGSAADQAAGTMQNGTLLGNATVVTDPARGEVLNLDGNGDALQIDSLFGQAPNVTVGGWVNLSALSSGRAEFISLNDRVHLALDDAGGVKGSVQVSAGAWTDLNSNRFLAGTGWHHVMYVFDDANDVHSLYIDGSLIVSAANTNTIYYTGATTTYIGRHPTTTPGFDFEGQLDDVRIYDRALTATEVGALAIDFDRATSAIAVTVTAGNDAPTFDAADFVAATSIGAGNDRAYATVVQPDGKIVVAGYTHNGSNLDFVLVRYNADGTLDTGFGGGDGIVTQAIGTGDDEAYAVALQADGKILVAGRTVNGTFFDFAVLRYTADGLLDTTFGGGDGIVITDFGASSNDTVSAVLVQSDGKIVVGGTSANDFAVARYLSDGTLDTSFSGDGKQTLDIAIANDEGRGLALQTDGKIVQAGTGFVGGVQNFALVRYNADGSVDTGFGGGDGIVTTAISTDWNIAQAVEVQSDGKIVVGGYSRGLSDNDFTIVRYTSTGTLDTSFGGGDGIVTTNWGSGDSVWGMSLQSDDKIVVAGGTGSYDLAVARYLSDGSLDTSFSGDGKQTINLKFLEILYAVDVAPDGRIVAAGYTSDGGSQDFVLTRLTSSGELDTRANSGTTSLGGTVSYTENGSAVVLDSNVRIYDTELSAANNFNGATLTLVRSGGASAQDVFSATGNLAALTQGGNLVLSGITVGTVTTHSAGTLLLTFNSSATQARINEVMNSIAYANSSDTPPASVVINWTFNDGNTGAQGTGGALTATGSTTVSITAVNDAPVVTTTGTALAYTENAAATAVDSGLTVSDVDTATLASATVSLTAGFVSGQDVLAFTNQNGITGSWNAGTGVLTLSGSATLANYQSALRSVTYLNSSDAPSTATRTVAFVTSDGSASSAAVTRDIAVTAVNDAPVVTTTGTVLAYTENDAATVVDSSLTVSDVDTATLASATVSITAGFVTGQDTLAFTNQNGITGSWSAGTGVLTLSGSATLANYQTALRSVTYINTSDNPSAATRTVSFVTSDGSASSSAATRDITITAVNDAPVVTTSGSALAYTENDSATAVDTGLTVSDVDTATLASATVSIT
uniref:DUF4347 domain-containing protein n=1 Tax=Zoogloea sp. TaxID=49181 RepID=UPI00262434A2